MPGNLIGAQKRAAAHLGITLEEYINNIAKGLKWCTKCKAWRPRGRFYPNNHFGDGLSPACIDCMRLRGKRKLIGSAPSKQIQSQASSAVEYEIKCGRMLPATSLPCSDCGDKAIHYHHHLGYERSHWLDVIPMCRSCHRKRHFTSDPNAW